jgi:hypothetical protein
MLGTDADGLGAVFVAGAPSIRFIFGEPMKAATKRFFGVL